jgi:hypothetical protein
MRDFTGTLSRDDLARLAASVRAFGVSSSEAVAAIDAVNRIPLPPHLEAMLARAVVATRPGWWMTPRGWLARWRFGRGGRG